MKTLTMIEERTLFQRWRNGDELAGNDLVAAFTPWCMTIAKNYSGGKEHDEELQAAALEGLADAMRQFDLNRKHNGRPVRFSSFARILVNQSVQRQVNSRAKAQDHLSFCGAHVPEHVSDTVSEEDPNNDQSECVQRLMTLIGDSPHLTERTKEVMMAFVRNPELNLETAGDELGITREGVRQHLLKIRHAVRHDPELLQAAKDAGLRMGS